jgi:23S rRNA pseudouridine1911/1915/1917 synthase
VGKDLARPGVVHRLDRDTSGCIVFAKTDEAHWKLGRQFEQREVDKRYLAIAHGTVEPRVFVIDLPIGPHPSREKGYREKYVVRHDELGKPSVTVVRVREAYALAPLADAPSTRPPAKASPKPATPPGWSELPRTANLVRAHASTSEADMLHFSLVELELKTGRTHQIRVHLSHNLWPIVGDDMYGGKAWSEDATKPKPNPKPKPKQAPAPAPPTLPPVHRQCLHAATLGFRHPITGESLVFTAPLRGDMADLVRALRALDPRESAAPPGASVDLARALG